MTRKLALSLLTAAIVWSMSSICQAQPQPLMTRHVRDAVSSRQAQMIGRLPASQTLRFDVVLALRHEPELDNFLEDIYNPDSPNYRQFVSVEEFTKRFGPSQEDYDAVLNWAKANGLKLVGGSRDGMDVQLTGTVAAIEKALHVTMNTYQHPTDNRVFFAPDREPAVDLPFALWHVSGLDNYSLPHPMLQHRDAVAQPNIKGSCPSNSYCASDMRAAYYGGTTLTGTGQTIGILELAGSDLADVKAYYKATKQKQPYTPTLISEGGYSTACLFSKGCDDTEQTLDMTQAMGMAPGTKMLYMFVCGNGSSFSDTACFSGMSTHTPLSAQLSGSWSWQPADPGTDDPYFKKFAAQGQNFFTASGDSGSYPSPSSPFYYPAEDAYVTAVGGTDLVTTAAGGAWSSETAWPDGGGGITQDGIPIPAWQKLTGVVTSGNHGSKTLRNIPDVAAEANLDFFVCADQSGCGTGWGGTSFAAPMWAGYMALVNQQAVTKSGKPLGFINPLIYPIGVGKSYTTSFHDITSGSNGKYKSGKAYDLVTGWGSPNGAGLINALAP